MKRIKCKSCGRVRWARPKSGEGTDVLKRVTLPSGRDVMASSLPARNPDCLPCRRRAQPAKSRPVAKAKVFGEMTRVVIRKAKDETAPEGKGKK